MKKAVFLHSNSIETCIHHFPFFKENTGSFESLGLTASTSNLTVTEISPHEHTICNKIKNLESNFGKELLKIHRVLPKLMAFFRRRTVEIGVMLLMNSCATLRSK